MSIERKHELRFGIFVLCAMGALVYDAGAETVVRTAVEWENPSVNSRNRLPPRTYSVPLVAMQDALNDALEPASPWAQSLNGEWKISWAGNPSLRVKDFWRADFDDTTWCGVDVPSCLETRGFGSPQYTNIECGGYRPVEWLENRGKEGGRPLCELTMDGVTILKDPAQDLAAGPRPMDKYLFTAQREEWTVTIRPVEANAN